MRSKFRVCIRCFDRNYIKSIPYIALQMYPKKQLLSLMQHQPFMAWQIDTLFSMHFQEMTIK